MIDVARLKALILASADLRERSYGKVSPGQYALSETEAAGLACQLLTEPAELARLIGPALSHAWNDVLAFAGDHSGRASDVEIPWDFIYPTREPVSLAAEIGHNRLRALKETLEQIPPNDSSAARSK